MPIPKPHKDETKDEFISRCMGDDVMVEEYPDEKQRAGICYSQWKEKEGKGMNKLEKPSEEELTSAMKETRQDNIQALIDWVASVGFDTCVDALTGKEGIDDPEKVCGWLKGQSKSHIGQVEKRAFPVELRLGDGDTLKILGHAAIFNKLSADLGGFREKIVPGAFIRALESSDVRALWNHDANIVLGRQRAGTLKIEEDEKGLYFEIDPPSWASGYLETIKRGDVTGASFAFIVAEGGENWDKQKGLRTITEVGELLDISPVAYPAYPQTNIRIRMDERDKEEIIEGVGRYLQPVQTEKLDSQGVDSDGSGRVGSLDILRKKLDVAER